MENNIVETIKHISKELESDEMDERDNWMQGATLVIKAINLIKKYPNIDEDSLGYNPDAYFANQFSKYWSGDRADVYTRRILMIGMEKLGDEAMKNAWRK